MEKKPSRDGEDNGSTSINEHTRLKSLASLECPYCYCEANELSISAILGESAAEQWIWYQKHKQHKQGYLKDGEVD
jgi:hypothetical protein